MERSQYSHLLPLSANYSNLELVIVYVAATAILQTFLILVAALVEITSKEFKRSDWRLKRLPQIKAEIVDSLTNPPAAIFCTMAFDVLARPHLPSAERYDSADAPIPAWPRLLFEIACVFWGADIFIYFEHRFMHTKFMYAKVHKIHHTYHIPTAFAGFANHWAEACFFTFASLWIQFFVAVHPLSHGIFGIFGAVWTILSHDDRSYHDHGFHYQHHFNPNRNFGAFTPIWDNLFGTRHVAKVTYREEVKDRMRAQEKWRGTAQPMAN